MRWKPLLILLLLPALLVRASGDGNNGKALARGRGKKAGGYTLTMAGDFTGSGSVAVTDTDITISVMIQYPNGSSAQVAFNNLPLANDRFVSNSGAIRISGRVDVPAGTDSQQTGDQAVTARVTAMVSDASGKAARLVAVQNPSSRGAKP